MSAIDSSSAAPRYRRVLAAGACVLALTSLQLQAQGGRLQEKSLSLESARIRYQEAQKNLERARELFDEKLLSRAQLEAEETQGRLARVELQRAYLSLFQSDPQIVISQARKYRDRTGGVRVALEIAALWSIGSEAGEVDEVVREALAGSTLEGISNVILSLKTVRGYRDGVMLEPTIISIPYEKQLPLLRFNTPVVVEFGLLLQDVEEVLVEFRHGDRQDQRQVRLAKGSAGGDGSLAVRSAQIALEAEFSAEAVYRLTLERFSTELSSFAVSLHGLPPEISSQLTDPATGAFLSQVFFPEGVTSRELSLSLRLPDRPTEAVPADTPLAFSVRFAHQAGDGELAPGDGTANDGQIDLQLVPRGVVAFELVATNLFHATEPGREVGFEVRLRNTGSRKLEQVEVGIAVPNGWRADAEPRLVSSLPAGGETVVALRITPPPEVPVGDYEGTITAETLAGTRSVLATPKTLRLHVEQRSSAWLTGLMIAFLAACLAGVVYGGVRLSRR